MHKMLHILNGDASVPAFRAANLPGHMLVWREIISEGPVVPEVREDSFWEVRQQYICQVYNEQSAVYQEKVLVVLQELKQLHGYDELVLWFDTDLMCQINMLFLLNYMKPLHHQKLQIATPEHGIVGGLNAQEMQEVLQQRIILKPEDLNLAQQLWQGYADESPLLLQELLQGDLHLFRHLKQALTLHFLRFPSCATGLNQLETLILEILQKNGPMANQALHEAIWEAAAAYGYGDKQLDLQLQPLQPLLVQVRDGLFDLTELGRKVLQQNEQLPDLRAGITYIGGVRLGEKTMNWCRDAADNKIKPATQAGNNL